MRFLADENFPGEAVKQLQAAGQLYFFAALGSQPLPARGAR
jgi:hypothetical protein